MRTSERFVPLEMSPHTLSSFGGYFVLHLCNNFVFALNCSQRMDLVYMYFDLNSGNSGKFLLSMVILGISLEPKQLPFFFFFFLANCAVAYFLLAPVLFWWEFRLGKTGT